MYGVSLREMGNNVDMSTEERTHVTHVIFIAFDNKYRTEWSEYVKVLNDFITKPAGSAYCVKSLSLDFFKTGNRHNENQIDFPPYEWLQRYKRCAVSSSITQYVRTVQHVVIML